MVEIGCFQCGSVLQWLKSPPQLEVIGIDPWKGDWAGILKRYRDNPVFEPCWKDIRNRDWAIATVEEHGPYKVAIANVQLYRERFFPVIGKFPDYLYLLSEAGVNPDLIYFDSDKILDDLEIALELFPKARLSGDDWTWGAHQGFPVQKAVQDFCMRHGFTVEAERATWLIHSS